MDAILQATLLNSVSFINCYHLIFENLASFLSKGPINDKVMA